MSEPCDCCTGTQAIMPLSIANRPGLNALHYRIGTHAAFLEAMKTRLSTLTIEVPASQPNQDGNQSTTTEFMPLQALTTRDQSDPAIALLDAWAVLADILTFYQERIANEGFLRTATERRSILELGRLAGYQLRPGVAASVYLAYTVDQNTPGPVLIPAGSRVQSVPQPGETMQSFETSAPLEARSEWNILQPRLTRPQYITQANLDSLPAIFVKGIASNLKPNNLLLFLLRNNKSAITKFIATVNLEPKVDRTKVTLQQDVSLQNGHNSNGKSTANDEWHPYTLINTLQPTLELPPIQPSINQYTLQQKIKDTYHAQSDIAVRLLAATSPRLDTALYPALANAQATPDAPLKDVYVFRIKAALFGHNAPLKLVGYTDASEERAKERLIPEYHEWPVENEDIQGNILYLDAQYDQIIPGSYIAVDHPTFPDPQIYQVIGHDVVSRAGYGITARITKLTLEGFALLPWWVYLPFNVSLQFIREQLSRVEDRVHYFL